MAGALVEEMVPPGTELLVGAVTAGEFGHLVGFGLGGTNVELFGDVAFALAPLTDHDARALPDRIRGVRALAGYRGRPAVDRDRLDDVLLRVSALVSEYPRVQELDLNPIVALPSGALVIVDARVRVG